jgi:hypothetical protein
VLECELGPSLKLLGQLRTEERLAVERTVLRLRSAAKCAMQGGIKSLIKRDKYEEGVNATQGENE